MVSESSLPASSLLEDSRAAIWPFSSSTAACSVSIFAPWATTCACTVLRSLSRHTCSASSWATSASSFASSAFRSSFSTSRASCSFSLATVSRCALPSATARSIACSTSLIFASRITICASAAETSSSAFWYSGIREAMASLLLAISSRTFVCWAESSPKRAV